MLSRGAYRSLQHHPDVEGQLRQWLQPRLGTARPPTRGDLLALLRWLWDVDDVIVDDALTGTAEVREGSPAAAAAEKIADIMEAHLRQYSEAEQERLHQAASEVIAERRRAKEGRDGA